MRFISRGSIEPGSDPTARSIPAPHAVAALAAAGIPDERIAEITPAIIGRLEGLARLRAMDAGDAEMAVTICIGTAHA